MAGRLRSLLDTMSASCGIRHPLGCYGVGRVAGCVGLLIETPQPRERTGRVRYCAQTRTFNFTTPRNDGIRRYSSGSSVSRRFGNRLTSVAMPIFASRRASGAPRQ